MTNLLEYSENYSKYLEVYDNIAQMNEMEIIMFILVMIIQNHLNLNKKSPERLMLQVKKV